jgi:hypothetical protein
MCRIDGPGITAKVLENPFNDDWCLNAGDDTQVPTALLAGLDVNGEHPLEALCP